MLDYRFIKSNLDAVNENIRRRNIKADATLVVELFNKRTELTTKLQDLQKQKRDNSKAMSAKLSDAERDSLMEKGKNIK